MNLSTYTEAFESAKWRFEEATEALAYAQGAQYQAADDLAAARDALSAALAAQISTILAPQ